MKQNKEDRPEEIQTDATQKQTSGACGCGVRSRKSQSLTSSPRLLGLGANIGCVAIPSREKLVEITV